MSYKIQYYKGKKGWYIRIIAKNGKIVADGGEAYATSGNARRASIRLKNTLHNATVEIK